MSKIKKAKNLCYEHGMWALSDALEAAISEFTSFEGITEDEVINNWLCFVDDMKHACETILRELG